MAMFTSAYSDNYPAGVNDFDIIDAFGHGDWYLDYKCEQCAYCVKLDGMDVYVCLWLAMEDRQHEAPVIKPEWEACENLEERWEPNDR